ncbi:hypothetical protein PIB30_025021 [Stylosanthes scabra]|uniref:Uncharacterized protein n=1 Tax=Stylosanthes scabra TaxID=79078 RepID=A0ABU6Q9J2_9FABA|nr:hypothetical protein [Stylosanthes scabra]
MELSNPRNLYQDFICSGVRKVLLQESLLKCRSVSCKIARQGKVRSGSGRKERKERKDRNKTKKVIAGAYTYALHGAMRTHPGLGRHA